MLFWTCTLAIPCFWTCIHNTIVDWTCNMIIPLFCINGYHGTMICGHVPWRYYVFRDMIIIPLFTYTFFFFGACTIMMPFYSLNYLGVPWYMKMEVMFNDVSIWSEYPCTLTVLKDYSFWLLNECNQEHGRKVTCSRNKNISWSV